MNVDTFYIYIYIRIHEYIICQSTYAIYMLINDIILDESKHTYTHTHTHAHTHTHTHTHAHTHTHTQSHTENNPQIYMLERIFLK